MLTFTTFSGHAETKILGSSPFDALIKITILDFVAFTRRRQCCVYAKGQYSSTWQKYNPIWDVKITLTLRHEYIMGNWDICKCLCTKIIKNNEEYSLLTHWGRDKMVAFSQTILSNAFSWTKLLEFRLKIHWSLFLRVLLTISQHWFW